MGSRVRTGLGVAALIAAVVAGGRFVWTGFEGDAEPVPEQPSGAAQPFDAAQVPTPDVTMLQTDVQAQPSVSPDNQASASASGDTPEGDPAQADMPAVADSEAVPSQTAAADDPTALAAPALVQIDVLRLEADGSGVIAGQVSPPRNLRLRLVDEELAEVIPDAQGRFVAFLTIPPSDSARRLFVEAEGSQDAAAWVMIAPRPAAETPPVGSSETAATVEAAEAPDQVAGGSDDPVREASGDPAPPAGPAALTTDRVVADVSPATVTDAPEEAPEEADMSAAIAAPGTNVQSIPETGPDTAEADVSAGQGGTEWTWQSAHATSPAQGAPHSGASPLPAAPGAGGAGNVDYSEPGAEPQPTGEESAPATEPSPLPAAPVTAQAVPATPATPVATEAAAELVREPGSNPQLQAQTPGALLVSDQGGVRLLGQAPAAPQGVSLSVISYDSEGDVRLSGTSGDGIETLRLYVDNRPLHETPSRPEGQWQTELPGIDPGNYTLRVDGVTADGTVLAQVESPFRREDPEAVVAVMNDEQIPVRGDITRHIVQPGNSLWLIAEQTYGDGVFYVQLYRANRDLIRNPDLIYPGQVFRLPDLD